jgi:hypothetical protein
MPNITIDFDDGTSHIYENVPDNVTPEQVYQRAAKEFNNKAIKHLAKDKKSNKAIIPGQEGEEARVAAERAKPQPTFGDKAIGVGEAALSTATGLFSGIQAPVAGLVKGAFGMVPDVEQETARLMQQQTFQPRTEKGQDYTANVGQFMNDVLAPLGPGNLTGLALARPIPGLLRKEKVPVQPMAPDRTAILKGVEVDEPTTPYTKTAPEAAADDALVARLEAAINKQNPKQGEIRVGKDGEAYFTSPEAEYARKQAEQRMLQENEAAYADPFNRMSRELAPDEVQPAPTPIDPFEQIRAQALAAGDQQRYQQAQAAIEARQKQLEFETARQTLLDQQAADRTRQGQAPTGAAADVARLRETQNRRLPGDNTPLEMDSPYPVDIKQFPQVMQDAPYQYKGGLDFNAAEFQSLPVEKQIQVKEAWKRRNIERQAEQDAVAKQEQRLQEMEDTLLPMEEALREGAYKPTGDGQGPKTRAAKAEAAPRVRQMRKGPGGAGQGGSTVIFGDLAEGIVRAGKAVKAKFTGQVPPKPDTISTPRSAATIAAKQAKAAKANAIGLKDSVYTSPTTFEEVKANPGKDIGFEKIGVGRLSYTLDRPRTPGQDLGAGMYSAIRRNAPNNVLKYTNRLFTEARLEKIKDSVTLITGKGGYNDLLSKLTPEEKIIVAQDSLILDKTGSAWTPEKAQQLGYSPAMKAMMDWRMKANETIANKADAVLAEQGLAPLNRRVSYASSNYDTAYTSLVYVKGKDKAGKDTTKVVLPVNGNSLWEYREALKWAKEKYKGDEFVFTKMERRGLNTESTKKYRGIPKEGLLVC